MNKYNSDMIDRQTIIVCQHGHYRGIARPVIVCLCGSTRFIKEFQDANMRERR